MALFVPLAKTSSTQRHAPLLLVRWPLNGADLQCGTFAKRERNPSDLGKSLLFLKVKAVSKAGHSGAQEGLKTAYRPGINAGNERGKGHKENPT